MSERMSLYGGLDVFRLGRKRMGDGPSPKGRKVVFMDHNGSDCDLEYARRFFKKGQILTVEEIFVDSSSSEVKFLEYPDNNFNTVMFNDYVAEPVKPSRVDEIKERLKNSTYGHWKIYETDTGTHIGTANDHPQLKGPAPVVTLATNFKEPSQTLYIKREDAEFIAKSKEDVEWLIEERQNATDLLITIFNDFGSSADKDGEIWMNVVKFLGGQKKARELHEDYIKRKTTFK